jgi:Do/DeqQ family serine protease
MSTAAIGLISAPVALSQVTAEPAIQPVQFFGQSSSQSAMSFDAQRGVLTMAPLLERVTPAVVSINTEVEERERDELSEREQMLERFFGGRLPGSNQPRPGLGSGVIVDAGEGLILTNNHVIDGADRINVTLEDRRRFEAEVVGTDPASDIALLKIDANDLTALRVANSEDVRVGDYVIAVGNPFGLSSTVTSGIVSALGRDQRGGDTYSDYIQTDAAINPGNSGGALVNSKGELIGINTAIISRSGSNAGIGFAVPTRIARNVMDQIQEFGEVRRGRIGVLIGNVTPEIREGLGLASLNGALVSDVVKDSPAEKAGLREGDVVIAFNGEDVIDSSDLRNAVGLLSPGADADITYLRDGRRRTTRITVEAREETREVLDESATDDIPSMESFSGATITDIPEDLELADGNDGVFVSAVRSGSRAARSGLRRGDVIRRINRTDIDDLRDFEDFLEDNDGPYALVVERDGQTAFLGVR